MNLQMLGYAIVIQCYVILLSIYRNGKAHTKGKACTRCRPDYSIYKIKYAQRNTAIYKPTYVQLHLPQNMAARDLPDIYPLSLMPVTLGLRVHNFYIRQILSCHGTTDIFYFKS